MKAASASLPDPDSPVTSTFASVGATRSASPTASRIASDNATISITIFLSKNSAASDRPEKHQDAAPRATNAQGHKSGGPSRQKCAPQSRRNQPGSIQRSDTLRRGPPDYHDALTARRFRR